MGLKNQETLRIWVRLPADKHEQFEKWSIKIGLPMSQLVAICAWTGAKTVIPALDPDARTALEILKDREEEELYAQMADEHFEAKAEWEEFQKWKQERGLHNDEQ